MDIKSKEDVLAFFRKVVEKVGEEWHPDDDYSWYVDKKTKEPLFSPEEAELYNRLQQECFVVCDELDIDIYDLGWEVVEKMFY